MLRNISLFILLLSGISAFGQYTISGNASVLPGNTGVQLTANTGYQAGWAYYNTKFDLSRKDSLCYKVYLGNTDGGGDGMTFIMHNDPRGFSARGCSGEALGYGSHPNGIGSECGFGTRSAILRSIAIEFDTYQNTNQGDPADDHLAYLENGNMYHQSSYATTNLENGVEREFKIVWTPTTKTIDIFLDGIKVISRVRNLDSLMGSTEVYWGFSASTGGAFNQQYFKLLNNQTLSVNAPVVRAINNGNWSNGNTWNLGGAIPEADDSIVIPTNISVTLNQDVTLNNLTVNGALLIDNTASRSIVVNNNLSVSSSGSISPTNANNATHTLTLYGNLNHSGVLNLNNGLAKVNLQFTGTANQVVNTTATASLNLFSFIVDKGTSANATLSLLAAGNWAYRGNNNAGFLTLQNGTVSMEGQLPFTTPLFTNQAYTLTASSQVVLNNPNVRISGQNGNPTINGILQINAGIYEVGNSSNQQLIMGNTGIVNLTGGRLNIAGFYNFNRGTLTITGGELRTATIGNSTGNPAFDITGGTFSQTGGVIRIASPNVNGSADLNLSSGDMAGFTGGDIQLGAETAANTQFTVKGYIYKLSFENGKSHTAVLNGTTYITNQLNLANGTLNIGSNSLNISGNLINTQQNPIIGNSSASLTFTGTGNTELALSNQANQIGSLTINRSGATITLLSNIKINSTLSLTSGKLQLSNFTLTINGTNPTISTTATNSIIGGTNAGIALECTGSKTIFFDQTTDGTTNALGTLIIKNSLLRFTPGNKLVLQNLIIATGKLDISNQTMSVIDISGDSINNIYSNASSNLTILGANSAENISANISSIGTLVVNREGGNVTLNSNITANTISIIAGSLQANGKNITFTSWENNGGSFNGSGAKVTATGTASVGGSTPTNFNDFEISNGTALTFNTSASANKVTTLSGGNNIIISLNDTIQFTANEVTLTQPTSNNRNTVLNIGNANALINGNLNLTGTSNTSSRLTQINITNGVLAAYGGINVSGTATSNKIFNMTAGSGTLVLADTITSISRASLVTANSGSSVKFEDASRAQTLTYFGSGSYENLIFANASTNGISLASAITTTNVKGNITVNSGTLNNAGFTITGNTGKTFRVDSAATFVHSATTFPTGFSNTTLHANSTINYALNGAQNIALIPHGNLTVSGGNIKSMTGSLTVRGALQLTQGKLNVGANALTLQGGFNGSAQNCLMLGTSADLILNGTGNIDSLFSDQTGTNNHIKTITYNRNGNTIGLGNTLIVTDAVIPTSGTLASNGFLILKSTATATARVGQGSGNYLTGSITVQRYVPAVIRRYRFFSPPTQNFTHSQFIDDMFISGPGGTNSGFDASNLNSNTIFTYQESTIGNRGWKGATNINNTIAAGQGIMVFVRGDRTIGIPAWYTQPFPAQNVVNLDFFGVPNTGTISPTITYTNTGSLANDGWNLVGNPYPSPINWNSITKTNLSAFYYTFNPATGSYVANTGLTNIASGQAFFVQAIGANPSLTFTESSKVSSAPVNFFKTANAIETIQIRMTRDSVNSDEATLLFNNSASAGYVVNEDAPKFYNSLINLSILTTDKKEVQINNTPNPTSNDTFLLVTNTYSGGNYTLDFGDISTLNPTTAIYLLDKKLNTSIDLRTQPNYTFSISLNDTTTYKNRFALVLNVNGVLPVELLNFKAQKVSDDVMITWATASEKNSSHFEVQRSNDGTHFTTVGKVTSAKNSVILRNYSFADKALSNTNTLYYRLKQVDIDNQYTYSSIVTIVQNQQLHAHTEIYLYPNPTVSNIHVEANDEIISYTIVNNVGQRFLTTANLDGNSAKIDVNTLPAGLYYINIITTGKAIQQPFIKE